MDDPNSICTQIFLTFEAHFHFHPLEVFKENMRLHADRILSFGEANVKIENDGDYEGWRNSNVPITWLVTCFCFVSLFFLDVKFCLALQSITTLVHNNQLRMWTKKEVFHLQLPVQRFIYATIILSL